MLAGGLTPSTVVVFGGGIMRNVDYWERIQECARRAEQSNDPIYRATWQRLVDFWRCRAADKAQQLGSDLKEPARPSADSGTVLEKL
jgi:hypothetical protein